MTSLLALGLLAITYNPTGPTLLPFPANQVCNGIVPVEVKVYNDVTFKQRLAGLSNQLGGVLKLDPSKILEGLFTFQGLTSDRTGTAIGFQSNPLPSVDSIVGTAFTNGEPSAVSKDLTATRTEQTTTKQPSVTPTIPQSSPVAASFTSPNGVSLDALSRLEQYTQLYNEIISLQMAIERAASHVFDVSSGKRRIPVVMSVPLSISPEKCDKGHVAQVEVEISCTNLQAPTAPNDILLSAVIPEKKTYNVARSTTNQSQAQAGVILGVFNLGGSMFSARERLYLAKDYDTIAFQSPSSDPSIKKFGWMFRPVLGQSYVDPGKREALFSLSLAPSLNNTQELGHEVTVKVTTSWHRLSGTSVSRTAARKNTYTSTFKIDVPKMSPEVKSLSFKKGAAGAVDVTVAGQGLFSSMDLLIGNRLIPGAGVYNPSSNLLKFSITGDEFLNQDASFLSMFGTTRYLGVTWDITAAGLEEAFKKMASYAVEDTSKPGRSKLQVVIPGHFQDFLDKDYVRPLIGVGDLVLGISEGDVRVVPQFESGGNTIFEASVPTDVLLAQSKVTLALPFVQFSTFRPVRKTTIVSFDRSYGFDCTTVKASGVDGAFQLFTITGRNLQNLTVDFPVDRDLVLLPSERQKFEDLNKELARAANPSVCVVAVPKKLTEVAKHFILRKKSTDGYARLYEKAVPFELTPEPPKPAIVIATVQEGHEGAVTVTGDILEKITEVRCDSRPIRLVKGLPATGGKPVWKIEVPSEIMKKPGDKELSFVVEGKTTLFVTLKIEPKKKD